MAQTADYATFSLLTGASLCVGWYLSFHRKALPGATADEIFLGSKSIRMFPLAMSVLATMASATGVIGTPAHMYAYGFHLGWITVSNLILIPIGFCLVVPVLYELQVTSVFQYLRMRYNTVISVIAAAAYVMLSQMVGAITIYASAVAVSTVFNISSIWCSITIGLAATAYAALGGLRGVVWADCLQALLTMAVPILVIIKVAHDTMRGHIRAQPLAELDPRQYYFNIAADLTTDETVWAILIASSPTFLNRVCLDQMTAQRYLASKNLSQAKLTLVVGTVLTCLYYALLAAESAALSCRYRGCDPQMLGQIQRVDQLLPFYVLEDLSGFPGLPGVFLAGVVSASISTTSSMVNSQAAVWYLDIVTPFFNVASKRVSCTIKALAFAAGCLMTAYSLVIPYLGSAMAIFMLVNAAMTGPYMGLLLLGFTAPFANSKGAGAVTLVMVAYQLAHMSCRIQNGMQEQRVPVSVDYCPENTTVLAHALNFAANTSLQSSNDVFPLCRLSSHWSSFFSAIATYLGGLVVSLLLVKVLAVERQKGSSHTENCLFEWKKVICIS
ncbi:sodium-coupled monocarboxylate transporter 1-like isoform X3 [Haemaphysalis longicornis]